MTSPRLVRNSLIAGHAAVAMVALAAAHVVLPAVPVRQWQSAGHVVMTMQQSPRRLPAARRADRMLTD